MCSNEIKLSLCGTYFTKKGAKIFDEIFKEALKFHESGLAAVSDETGWYHINLQGIAIYRKRYQRVFGYYFNRAAVIEQNKWYHIDNKGEKIYKENYAWCGNYQENYCTVRDINANYFHLDSNGKRNYTENYTYAGDYKDGFAVVKLKNGLCKHIDYKGTNLNGKEFIDLGVFHKKFATAKNEKGWFHINKLGNELYCERYVLIEAFYNGFALVETSENKKIIIDETGKSILKVKS